ncbi:MAG TPA: CoA-binding protein [Gemmataceae bacterium]|nr:CoA-binding protein [Gemmataceae bacterium]
MSRLTIAVVGASKDRRKFGNRAVRAYARQDWDVYPVNPHEASIEGWRVYRSIDEIPIERLDRVSLYVPPEVGMQLVEGIARRQPRELWLNPGAESQELIARAQALGLDVVVACSIVDIGESPAL